EVGEEVEAHGDDAEQQHHEGHSHHAELDGGGARFLLAPASQQRPGGGARAPIGACNAPRHFCRLPTPYSPTSSTLQVGCLTLRKDFYLIGILVNFDTKRWKAASRGRGSGVHCGPTGSFDPTAAIGCPPAEPCRPHARRSRSSTPRPWRWHRSTSARRRP